MAYFTFCIFVAINNYLGLIKHSVQSIIHCRKAAMETELREAGTGRCTCISTIFTHSCIH